MHKNNNRKNVPELLKHSKHKTYVPELLKHSKHKTYVPELLKHYKHKTYYIYANIHLVQHCMFFL